MQPVTARAKEPGCPDSEGQMKHLRRKRKLPFACAIAARAGSRGCAQRSRHGPGARRAVCAAARPLQPHPRHRGRRDPQPAGHHLQPARSIIIACDLTKTGPAAIAALTQRPRLDPVRAADMPDRSAPRHRRRQRPARPDDHPAMGRPAAPPPRRHHRSGPSRRPPHPSHRRRDHRHQRLEQTRAIAALPPTPAKTCATSPKRSPPQTHANVTATGPAASANTSPDARPATQQQLPPRLRTGITPATPAVLPDEHRSRQAHQGHRNLLTWLICL